MNWSAIIAALPALMMDGGELTDGATALVAKVEALFKAIEDAIPVAKTFVENLETSASSEAHAAFSSVISAYEDVTGEAKATLATAEATGTAVQSAVANPPAT